MKVFTEDITYLGVEIRRDRSKRVIKLLQTKYVDDLLRELIGAYKGVSKYPLSKSTFDELHEQKGQLSRINDVIDKLRYLVDRTRPDLLFSVGLLSRFMDNPSEEIMKELAWLIKYISFTRYYHLTLRGKNPIELFGMSDASFVQ